MGSALLSRKFRVPIVHGRCLARPQARRRVPGLGIAGCGGAMGSEGEASAGARHHGLRGSEGAARAVAA